jgi:hypothetical protein
MRRGAAGDAARAQRLQGSRRRSRPVSKRHHLNAFHVAQNDLVARKMGIAGPAGGDRLSRNQSGHRRLWCDCRSRPTKPGRRDDRDVLPSANGAGSSPGRCRARSRGRDTTGHHLSRPGLGARSGRRRAAAGRQRRSDRSAGHGCGGCDGMWSPVGRAAGAVTDIAHPSFTCGYYAYWAGVPTEGVEFYVRHGSDILVFPTHDGSTCIWAGRSHDHWDAYRKDVEHTYHEIIGLAPWLAERLRYSRQVSPFKGTSKLLNFYRQSFGKGWALVGRRGLSPRPASGNGHR